MKLLRYGPPGAERPGMLDEAGHLRDLSDHVSDIEGDVLSLTVRGAGGFAKEIALPHPVDPDEVRKSCKNGLLEVRLTKRSAQDD